MKTVHQIWQVQTLLCFKVDLHQIESNEVNGSKEDMFSDISSDTFSDISSDSLRRRTNARNVSFRISLRWPIHIINQII